MISPEKALSQVIANAPRQPAVEIALDTAVDRVLAEDIVSDVDMPPFDKSAMDGYAVCGDDVADAPTELLVVEEIPAGCMPARSVGRGECAKIMTGAPIPDGADTVVMIEHTEPHGQDRVRILRPTAKGRNVCLLGEDVRKGQPVVRRGKRLSAFDIALGAAAGRSHVAVYDTPTVAIVATGDEVVEPSESPEPGQIRNSNSYAIAARLRQAGVDAEYLGIAPDDRGALQARLADGLRRDVLVVSGGVSMGDYDLVPGILKELGVEELFHEIAVKPGKPTVFGRHGDTLVFGLPGNPVSTLVISELLLVPALRYMMGESDPAPSMVEAVLDGPLSHKGDRVSFRPVTLKWSGGALHAVPVEYHGSADLAGAARGHAFAAVPQGTIELAAGSSARVLLCPSSLS